MTDRSTRPVRRPVRVATHPDHHPYLDAVRPTDRSIRMVEMGRKFWDVAALVDAGIDVVHLHFGFEPLPLDRLETWTAGLRACGIALVHTVHDLANPHLEDQSVFERQVGCVIRSSDVLITLTHGAAREIELRFGRNAHVLPHPPIYPDCPGPHPTRDDAVTTNLGQLRPNVDLDVVERVAASVSRTGGMSVHVRDEAVQRSAPGVRLQLDRISAIAGARLYVSGHLSDEDLICSLRSARVVLLPYRWGTHSGMLEAAIDCGATPLASRCGNYGDQGAALYNDPEAAAVTALGLSIENGPATAIAEWEAHRERSESRRSRGAVAARTHERVYRSVAGTGPRAAALCRRR